MRELAGRLGMSSSAVSQIETGKSQPSVRTLRALASELGMSVDDALFGGREQRLARDPAHAVQNASRELGIAAQPGEQQRERAIDSGVRWEFLTAWDDDTEFLKATFGSSGASNSDKTFAQHSGIEFGLVLSGILHVTLGFEELVLNPGESITFASSTPHRISNEGTETVHAVWVVRGRRGAAMAPDGAFAASSYGRRASSSDGGRLRMLSCTPRCQQDMRLVPSPHFVRGHGVEVADDGRGQDRSRHTADGRRPGAGHPRLDRRVRVMRTGDEPEISVPGNANAGHASPGAEPKR